MTVTYLALPLISEAIKGEAKIDPENERDLQKLYDYFVRNNLSPFYPEDRSIGRVKEAIYLFCKTRLGMDYVTHFAEIINIVLSPKNMQHFVNVIDSTKVQYIAETQKRETELIKLTNWEIPHQLNYGEDFEELSRIRLSVLQPFYNRKQYDGKRNEEAFIDFLERSENVQWWFKNGDRDSTYFAVPYTENGVQHPFYVDFIGIFSINGGKTSVLKTSATVCSSLSP